MHDALVAHERARAPFSEGARAHRPPLRCRRRHHQRRHRLRDRHGARAHRAKRRSARGGGDRARDGRLPAARQRTRTEQRLPRLPHASASRRSSRAGCDRAASRAADVDRRALVARRHERAQPHARVPPRDRHLHPRVRHARAARARALAAPRSVAEHRCRRAALRIHDGAAIPPPLARRASSVAARFLRYHAAHMSSEPVQERRSQILSGVVSKLLDDLKSGAGDKDRRRQVEEWMRTLAEKYPEFKIETGLRDYYLAEAERLRADFDKASDLTEKLALGRTIESFLDRASEYDRRIRER